MVLALIILGCTALGISRAAQQSEEGPVATETELKVPTGLAIADDDTLDVITFDGEMYRLPLRTGRIANLRVFLPGRGFGNLLVDPSGNLITTIPGECKVLRINVENSSVQTIAGKGLPPSGSCGSSGDNGPAVSASLEPDFIAQDRNGNLFVVDGISKAKVRRIDYSSGRITCLIAPPQLGMTTGVAVDQRGDVFLSQVGKKSKNRSILRMDASTGELSPIKGSEFKGNKEVWSAAIRRKLLFSDRAGNLYVLDDSRVFYIDFSQHFVSVVAGTKTKGFSGDGGPATKAQLYWPTSVAADSEGNIYIADSENQRIRRVDAKTHIITTIAGNGSPPHIPGTIEVTQ